MTIIVAERSGLPAHSDANEGNLTFISNPNGINTFDHGRS